MPEINFDIGKSFWDARHARDDRDQRKQAAADLHDERQRKQMEDYTKNLTEVLQDPDIDPELRKTSINSLMDGIESIRKKPVAKQFRTFVQNSPEDAFKILSTLREGGMDPQQILGIADDPLLFAHTLRAYGAAQREKGSRRLRGDAGAGEAPLAAGSASPSPSNTQGMPGGSGVSLGGVKAAQPFAQQSLTGAMGGEQAPAQAAPQAAPQAGSPEQVLADEAGKVQTKINAMTVRINQLASRGESAVNLAPFRKERADLETELRNLQMQAPLAAVKERAVEGVKPVSLEDLSAGREAAERAGNTQLAARFKPGMNRQAYNGLMDQISAPGAQVQPISVPQTLNSKPILSNPDGSISTERTITIEADGKHYVIPTIVNGKQLTAKDAIAAWSQGTNKEVGAFDSAAEADTFAKQRSDNLGRQAQAQGITGKPRPLVPSRQEKLTEQESTKRRETALPESLLRDPAVQAAGVRTYGEFEDAKAKGALRGVRTPEEIVGADEQARGLQQSGFKRAEELYKKADDATAKKTQIEFMDSVYRQLGPTGALTGPLREKVFNVLGLLGIQPDALKNIQNMQAASIQLVRATLKDFSGNDSDRDVLTAMAGSPGILKVKESNQALIQLALATHQRDILKAANARKWEGQYGNIKNKDPETGLAFEEAWDNRMKVSGPIISEELKRKMGILPKKAK